MDLTAFFIFGFVLYVAIYLRNKVGNKYRIKNLVDKFPGPDSYPFFGTNFSLLFLKREEFFPYFRKRAQKYFPVFRSWLGSIPMVHLMTAEHIEVVLNNSVNITKSFGYNHLLPWLGDGLLTSTGEKWHRHRKLLTPAFHFKILEGFVDIFVEKSKCLTKQLSGEANGKVFDIYPYITLCALDVISETAMGIQVNAMTNKDNEYVAAVYSVCETAVQRFIQPLLQSDFIFYKTSRGRKFKEHLSVLHGTTNKVINERRKMLKAAQKQAAQPKAEEDAFGKKTRLAFLDLLLDVAQDGTVLTQEEIRAEVDTFLFEGHDTTTAGICWALFLLGLHQNIQEEVYQQIEAVLPENKTPTLNDLAELKLLERVIKESLRLYPSVANIGRIASQDIDLGGQIIPAGCNVNVHIFELHRNPEYFPDPEKFDPDRFLPENIKNRHPYAYIPFSAGPRNCIGQRFAMAEEKTILLHILRRFKVTSHQTPENVQAIPELIVRPFNGLLVSLEERK